MFSSPSVMASASPHPAVQPTGKSCRCGIAVSRAFSLVEVVLALGVASFAMLSVLGLMPVALSSAGDALETSRVANIIQVVGSDLTQQGHSQLKSAAQPERFFDYEGVETQASEDPHFRVNVVVDDQFFVPGADAPSSHLLLARLEITPRGAQDPVRAVVSVPDTGR